jgi:hypothetical protein
MLNKLSVIFLILFLTFSITVFAQEGVISWDYPGDSEWENNLVGYNIYYSNLAKDQFNKTLSKSDLSVNATRVFYEGINDKLHLQYDEEYTLALTAFNTKEESVRSNSVVYTREGYSPPEDNLPVAVIHISGPVTIVIGD